MNVAYVLRITTRPDPENPGYWIARNDLFHGVEGRARSELRAVQFCTQAIADWLREAQRDMRELAAEDLKP